MTVSTMSRKRGRRLTTNKKVLVCAVALALTGLCIGAPVESQDDESEQSELVSIEDVEAEFDYEDEDEDVGEGRFLASLFFPLFPQYWPIDIGDNLNNLKSPATVARFVYRDITSVSGKILTLAGHCIIR